jgi:hypothetical protein
MEMGLIEFRKASAPFTVTLFSVGTAVMINNGASFTSSICNVNLVFLVKKKMA